MKYLWKYIERKSWDASKKYKMFTLFLSLISALVGLLAWVVIRPYSLSTLDWMICFMGYPVMVSLIAVFLYSCRNFFHDGAYE